MARRTRTWLPDRCSHLIESLQNSKIGGIPKVRRQLLALSVGAKIRSIVVLQK
jgi:hypothetical protein